MESVAVRKLRRPRSEEEESEVIGGQAGGAERQALATEAVAAFDRQGSR
jgi:hypothetical protein